MVQIVSECNQLPLHPRHPYVGELVFTAFSGSHQDAIKKSLDYNEKHAHANDIWDVAYLPIDPSHIGRSYQDVVRINSQSGKGGVAYILQRDYGFNLPRWMQIDFSRVVQTEAEKQARELKNEEILTTFERTYLQQNRFALNDFSVSNKKGEVEFTGQVTIDGKITEVNGKGSGALSAFVDGLSKQMGKSIHVINYSEHAINQAQAEDQTNANAVAYIQLNVDGQIYSGIGTCESTLSAMLQGSLSALSQI
ncbi:MAG: hypothetical protein CR966_01460 [Pseudomonadales bacterium]|nr:MAG: hypothetical protein CR966_01460 [Pseudomonadales bacterium]